MKVSDLLLSLANARNEVDNISAEIYGLGQVANNTFDYDEFCAAQKRIDDLYISRTIYGHQIAAILKQLSAL